MGANISEVASLSDFQHRLGRAGDERMRQIVMAAYELLAEEGLDGLTIRAVLARTGLARRAFYERFAGKDDLVLAVFRETLHLAADYFAGLVAGIADPLDRLDAIIVQIALGRGDLGTEEGAASDRRGAALSREHMRLAESHPAELASALSPLLVLIARQLADGMAAGAVRQADPDRLAALVYNLVSTSVHTELLSPEGTMRDLARRQRLAGELKEFCRRAVMA